MGKLNKKGTTLIEAMIAAAILTVAVLSMMYMVGYAFNEQKSLTNMSTQERIFQIISTDLRGDPSIYQKDFTPTSIPTRTLLADERLPIRFNDKTVCDNTDPKLQPTPTIGVGTLVDCCPACQGRMGYTIRPILGNPGMYMASVRVVHPDISGGEALYDLIISPK